MFLLWFCSTSPWSHHYSVPAASAQWRRRWRDYIQKDRNWWSAQCNAEKEATAAAWKVEWIQTSSSFSCSILLLDPCIHSANLWDWEYVPLAQRPVASRSPAPSALFRSVDHWYRLYNNNNNNSNNKRWRAMSTTSYRYLCTARVLETNHDKDPLAALPCTALHCIWTVDFGAHYYK